MMLFQQLRQEMGSSVDQTGGLGRGGSSYCGYVLKMELTGFADSLDIGDGRKEELGNSAVVACPERGDGGFGGVGGSLYSPCCGRCLSQWIC